MLKSELTQISKTKNFNKKKIRENSGKFDALRKSDKYVEYHCKKKQHFYVFQKKVKIFRFIKKMSLM